MARITSSEVVVLRSRPYRETSKLLTVFSRDFGKLQLQAKGARRPKSKFGAALEVLTLARVIFYRSEARHVYTLSDAEILDGWPRIRHAPERLRASAVMLEFTERNFEAEAALPRVFTLLCSGLQAMNGGECDPCAVAYAYMLKVAAQIGYAPQLAHCVACHKRKAATFSARRGGLLCASCSAQEPEAQPVSAETISGLHLLRDGTLAQTAACGLGDQTRELVRKYLQYHIANFDLKSLKYLERNCG